MNMFTTRDQSIEEGYIILFDNIINFKRVFGSVVVVAFQIAFRAEIHANDVFLFFKNHF